MGAMSELHVRMQDEYMNTVHQAENGELTMLDAFIKLEEERKELEQSLAIIKSFKDEHINDIGGEAENYKDGYNGYMVEIRNGGRVFNYKNIPEWQSYNKAVKNCEERHKQAFIAKEKGLLTASEDGEEIVLPEISYRKSSIILKKQK